jgi:hypothetical protein
MLEQLAGWGTALVDDAGGTKFLEYACAVALGVAAIDRVHAFMTRFFDETTPQARGKAVTRAMVRRIDFALAVFLMFLIIGAALPILKLYVGYEPGFVVELLVNVTLITLIVLALFMNVGELIDNRKFTLDRIWYQLRLLVRRGVDFSSIGTATVATGLKYQLQGLPVVDTLLSWIARISALPIT